MTRHVIDDVIWDQRDIIRMMQKLSRIVHGMDKNMMWRMTQKMSDDDTRGIKTRLGLLSGRKVDRSLMGNSPS